VVAPIAPGTAAGRYLDRRKGDGGYMYIVDCDDLDARRAHLVRHGVRLVEDLKVDDGGLSAEALHLHPRDTGGCLLSIDRHGPESSPTGSYLWAGRDWQSKARADVRIAGATLQCDDPAAVAARWSELLGRPVLAEGEGFGLGLDNASARFVPLGDDRGEGLSEVQLACADPARVLAAALAAGAGVGARDFEACGVRFVLSHA
jgi:hypothetical protein